MKRKSISGSRNRILSAEIHQLPLRMCILGGGGYLGQHLTKALQNAGHFVVVLDLHFQRFPHIVLDTTRMLQIRGSILDLDALRKALSGCDACFHMAGYGMSGGASLDYEMCMRVNFGGTQLIISECLRLNVPRLIYTSTIGVIFAQEELHMADETTPYAKHFVNAYCESKYLGEVALLQANSPGKLATCALRLRGIYGPGELRTVKTTVDLSRSGWVKATFRKSKLCLTQYSRVDNCVQALLLSEESLRQRNSPTAGQAYHIVDDLPAVDPFGFWYPLIEAAGVSVPKFCIPYWLAYFAAYTMEWLYWLTGMEPLFTRFEANLMAYHNTYSVEKAKRDFGYRPAQNHDLTSTIKFLQHEQKHAEVSKGNNLEQIWKLVIKFLHLLDPSWLAQYLHRSVGIGDCCGPQQVFHKFLMVLSVLILSSMVWPSMVSMLCCSLTYIVSY
ncbi:3-beta hydroxysteroid dehydrogenase/isomerase family domain-containing protein [Ditylenchus destructor]|uniref:3-beta hydroxysteroid dehydrogenase/isomerase family domain-containing protein n=1 Tax=Ditylenchus destructor TaxID=166010 RepID=A0AAD4NBP4_9BILA|nr:3-beta hydroxysteroid dehydrogenase/isomerase family domain-containing protein [Ditylenchus destructor]